jgi:hypothetical protein
MSILSEGLSEGPKIVGGNASRKPNGLKRREIGS